MSIVFYKEMGFSKGQIAIYSKGTLGWITTVVFHIIRRNICNEIWNGEDNVLLQGD